MIAEPAHQLAGARENFLEVGGLLSPAPADPVEPLGVIPREFVDLEIAIVRHRQTVVDGPNLDGLGRALDRLQILAGQLETVVPKGVFSRSDLLSLLPSGDAGLAPRAARDGLERDRGRSRDVGMARRSIRHDHRVPARRVLKVIIDPLLLHEPAGELKVGLAVLHAVLSRLERPLDLKRDVQVREHLLEDIGDGHMLKDPALEVLRQQPEPGDQLRVIANEGGPALRPATTSAWQKLLTMPLIGRVEPSGNPRVTVTD